MYVQLYKDTPNWIKCVHPEFCLLSLEQELLEEYKCVFEAKLRGGGRVPNICIY